MSITSALQQKHQEEQNSLCKAVKLLMQSPGYIEEFVGNFFCFCSPPRQASNTKNVRILLMAVGFIIFFYFVFFCAACADFDSPHGSHISQGEV